FPYTTLFRSELRRCPAEHLAVRGLVGVPLLPGVQIADVELPVLARVVEPGAEALRLLLFRDVDEELDDRRALVGEETLELDDVVIAPPPTRLGDEALDAYHEDVLVVAPVEYHDLPVAGALRMHPPQVVAGEFLLRCRKST